MGGEQARERGTIVDEGHGRRVDSQKANNSPEKGEGATVQHATPETCEPMDIAHTIGGERARRHGRSEIELTRLDKKQSPADAHQGSGNSQGYRRACKRFEESSHKKAYHPGKEQGHEAALDIAQRHNVEPREHKRVRADHGNGDAKYPLSRPLHHRQTRDDEARKGNRRDDLHPEAPQRLPRQRTPQHHRRARHNADDDPHAMGAVKGTRRNGKPVTLP